MPKRGFFMRTIRTAGLVFLTLVLANISLAQSHVPNFLISIWPEYDHPGVLVIFNGELNEQDVPMEVSFPIPEQSRFALVAGSTDTTANTMIPVPIQDSETGKEVTFTAVHPSFHVEFYFNPFAPDSAHRHYSYDFVPQFSVDSLMVDLQEPLSAQGFEPEMRTDHQTQDSHGIRYYRSHFNKVAAGDTIHIEAHYENPEGQMTNELMQTQMGGAEGQGQMGGGMPQSGGSSGGAQSATNNIWIILVLGLIVIGVIYFVTQSGGEKTPREEAAASPEQTEPGAAESISPADSPGGKKFCIHCGEQIPAEAKFCTKCGKSQGA